MTDDTFDTVVYVGKVASDQDCRTGEGGAHVWGLFRDCVLSRGKASLQIVQVCNQCAHV